MLSYPPAQFRNRKIPLKKKAPPAQAALTLTAAEFDATGPRVRMTFDRAIDIDGIDVASIRVRDGGVTLRTYIGTGEAELDGAATVVVMLQEQSVIGAGDVLLTVTDESGIIGAEGGAYAGVDELALPFAA